MKWARYYLAALLLHGAVLWGLQFPAPSVPIQAEHHYVDITLGDGPGNGGSAGSGSASDSKSATAETLPPAPIAEPLPLPPPPEPVIPVPTPEPIPPAPEPAPIPTEVADLPPETPPQPTDFPLPAPAPPPGLPTKDEAPQSAPASPEPNSASSSPTTVPGNPGAETAGGAPAGTGTTPPSGSGDGDGSAGGGGPRLLSRLNLTDLPGGQTGSVLLRLYVNNLGTVDKVEVVVSSGHPELDQTGIEAVKHARFRPAYDGPTPVPGRIEVRLSWGSGSKSYIWENSRGF